MWAHTGSPASPDYGPTGNRFTGEIEWVQLNIGEDSHHTSSHPKNGSTWRWLASRRVSRGPTVA
jgi:hypothetical protein